jgi:hypothetical protein
LLDPLDGAQGEGRVSKQRKKEMLAERALADTDAWMRTL